MALNREALIERRLKEQKERKEIFRIPFRGRAEPLPVIEVDIRELRYNVQVGRLAIDSSTILQVSEKNRDKDPDDPDVQDEIERLVMARRESGELRRHIRDEGQLQPGIISRDGVLINGNRRLAVLRSLFTETKDEKYRQMLVAVLPPGTTPGEMYLLEVTLQMTRETREPYGPITRLVHLRWGIDRHKLDKDQVANAMYLGPGEVDEQLEILQLMDEYLAYVKRPGAYYILEGGTEEAGHQGKYQHFFEVRRLKEKHGREPYWEAALRHVFNLIRSGATFENIRELKKWRADDFAEFGKTLRQDEPPEARRPRGKPAKPADEDLADLAGDIEGIAGRVSQVSAEASRLITMPKGPAKADTTSEIDPEDDPEVLATVEAVRTINEIVQTKRAQKKPKELLNQALRKLEAADQAIPKDKAIEDRDIEKILTRIADRANSLKDRLDDNAAPTAKKKARRR